MAKHKKKISYIRLAGLFGVLAGLVFLIIVLSAAKDQTTDMTCHSVTIRIDHEKGNFFIDREDVRQMILNDSLPDLVGHAVRELDLKSMERILNKNPFIQKADIYVDIKGNVFIDVQQREPVIRVINNKDVSYYIDKNGNKLPTSPKFTARVPVSNGHIPDNGKDFGPIEHQGLKDLYALAEFIRKDDFWKAQIVQVYLDKVNGLELIPRLGEHRIIFGNVDDMEGKFRKLRLFYEEGLKSMGWGNYRTINLKYKGQVVCSKF